MQPVQNIIRQHHVRHHPVIIATHCHSLHQFQPLIDHITGRRFYGLLRGRIHRHSLVTPIAHPTRVHALVHVSQVQARIHLELLHRTGNHIRNQIHAGIFTIDHNTRLVIIPGTHQILELLGPSRRLDIHVRHLSRAKSVLEPICRIIIKGIQTILQIRDCCGIAFPATPERIVRSPRPESLLVRIRVQYLILPPVRHLQIPLPQNLSPTLHPTSRLHGIFHQLGNRVRGIGRERRRSHPPFLRCDQNYAITGPRTIYRGCRRIFQYLHRLYRRGIQICQRVRSRHRGYKRVHRDTIHHVKRLPTISSGIPSLRIPTDKQRVVSPNSHHSGTPRSPGLVHDIHPRHASLQHTDDTRCRQFLHLLSLHGRYCADILPLVLRTVRPNNHLVQARHVLLHHNPQRVGFLGESHLLFLKTDKRKFQRPLFQRQIHGEPSFFIRRRSHGHSRYFHCHSRQRLFLHVIHKSLHPNVFRLLLFAFLFLNDHQVSLDQINKRTSLETQI